MDNKNTEYSHNFIQLLMSSQMRIYAFILGLVRNYQDADDLLQETVHTMWQKYEDCQPIENFTAWANQIAYYKILDFRKKQKSNSHIQSGLFEKLLPIIQETNSHADDHIDKLKQCLQKLGQREYKLIELRYYQNFKPQQIASELGLSILTIYKSMSRIHGRLLRCIENT